MEATEVLAMVGGHVDQELLARNEYLAAENEILKSKFEKPIRLNESEKLRLAKIGKRIGLKALKGMACIVTRKKCQIASSGLSLTWGMLF